MANSNLSQRFTGQVALVTGASSGLGSAIARAFAAEGARLVLTARNADRLQHTAAELPAAAQAMPIPCDISQTAAVEGMVSQAIARFGRIDILVNNAGIGMIAPFELTRADDAYRLFATNFFGATHCIRAVLPHMKRQHSGNIVNIASVGGLRGIPNISIYSASKAALIALSDSLRIELRDDGICVTTLCTGRIADTNFFDRAITYGPIQLYEALRPVAPTAVADALLAAILRRKSLVILPLPARLLHLANRLAPRLMDRYLHGHRPNLQPSSLPDP